MVKPKVVAIVGSTSSGKSALAIALAKALRGEIISADSRQVYQGMNIGTGKVSKEEMEGIPHHLLDIVTPYEIYTGADFLRDSTQIIGEITFRGTLPILAGGTFFYLDLLRGRMQPAPVPPDPILRTRLETLSDSQLLKELTQFDAETAARIDSQNRVRLIRAIEICHSLGKVPKSVPTVSPFDWLVVGIDVPVDALRERIALRIHERLKAGMIEEVQALHKSGVSWHRLDSFGLEYRYCSRYLQNEITREELVTELLYKSFQFAKRQRTWLRKDQDITWLPYPTDIDKTVALADRFLSSK